ncbi:hypothetical protein GGF46_001147 [Coemansia sp. RSA 552]|nr:hypothetical protein GGF46_001147 [Coemansia sp. RSA 552]
MKRQSGIGIIRHGADARGVGSGSSYFQRRAQPAGGGQQSQRVSQPAAADSGSGDTAASDSPAKDKPSTALHGLNAIAVLTNHPNKAPTRIHRSELPTVPRTHYPKIKKADFDEYLAETSAAFEQYAANAAAGYQVAADELNRYEAAVEDAEKVLETTSHTYSMDSTTMAERLKALDGTRSEFGLDSISEYGGGNADGAGARALPGIEDVPTIFFEEGFDLRDPATFDIVTQVVLGPQTATSGLFSPDKVTATSTAMQETLSGYMDVVEGYLTREISRRSPSFFAALSTLEELHAETDRCIEKIHVLRDDLKRTAGAQCAPGLELIRLRRRRENLSAVLDNVELLSNLQHTQATVDELVESGDFISAINLLIDARELTEPVYQTSRGSDAGGLVGTKAFTFLATHMAESLDVVTLHTERELVAAVLRDMREFVDDGLASPQGELLGQSQMDIFQANLTMHLTPFVCGLARTGDVGNALKAYRESLMSEATSLIESLYPSGFPRSQGHASFSDATQQRALGTAVQGQTFDQFCALLRQQQQLLLLVISHVGMVRRAILQILAENKPAKEPAHEQGTSPPQEPAQGEEGRLPTTSKRYELAEAEVRGSLNDTFDEFMDVAHIRCAKLLNHRSEQNSRLSLAGFYSLYTWIWQFVMQYEALGGKMCFGLRGALAAQAKAFLSNFHTEKSRQLQILIENEQWVQAEVPVDFQNLVNQVIEAAYAPDGDSSQSALCLGNTPASVPDTTKVPSQTSRPSAAAQPGSPASLRAVDMTSGPASLLPRTDSDAASIRSVDTAGMGLMHIGGESFHVVGCSLVLVKSVAEYLQCAVSIPVLAADVLQRLVEILKSFNSRSCQVVLGAGAMRSAGLKNISAKHLALASEALSLCMELIPYIKECLRHVLPASQEALLSQLDRASSDFANHQKELHSKLVAIMTERADYHTRMLNATAWDSLDHSAQPPVPAMDSLVKEVRKLHKVLKKYLPQAALRSVFAQIFDMYEAKLTAQYAQIRITSGEGKRQLMLNSQYLLQRLRALDASLPVDWELEVVVNNIDLVRPYQAAALSSPVPDGSSTEPSPEAGAQPEPELDLLSPSVTESPVANTATFSEADGGSAQKSP